MGLQTFIPVPYFASERSFAQFRLPEEARAIVGFGNTANTLHIVSSTGAFYTVVFDEVKGGACNQVAYNKVVIEDAPSS